jgi:flagellar biosynthesis anti-sigma factor FlgM
MKITDRKSVLETQIDRPDPVRPESGSEVGPGAPPTDRVNVSEGARELSRLRAAVGDLGAVREGRVAGLRAEMAKGQYGADLQDVARKILRELLGEILG